jgi:hypothetical protein
VRTLNLTTIHTYEPFDDCGGSQNREKQTKKKPLDASNIGDEIRGQRRNYFESHLKDEGIDGRTAS